MADKKKTRAGKNAQKGHKRSDIDDNGLTSAEDNELLDLTERTIMVSTDDTEIIDLATVHVDDDGELVLNASGDDDAEDMIDLTDAVDGDDIIDLTDTVEDDQDLLDMTGASDVELLDEEPTIALDDILSDSEQGEPIIDLTETVTDDDDGEEALIELTDVAEDGGASADAIDTEADQDDDEIIDLTEPVAGDDDDEIIDLVDAVADGDDDIIDLTEEAVATEDDEVIDLTEPSETLFDDGGGITIDLTGDDEDVQEIIELAEEAEADTIAMTGSSDVDTEADVDSIDDADAIINMQQTIQADDGAEDIIDLTDLAGGDTEDAGAVFVVEDREDEDEPPSTEEDDELLALTETIDEKMSDFFDLDTLEDIEDDDDELLDLTDTLDADSEPVETEDSPFSLSEEDAFLSETDDEEDINEEIDLSDLNLTDLEDFDSEDLEDVDVDEDTLALGDDDEEVDDLVGDEDEEEDEEDDLLDLTEDIAYEDDEDEDNLFDLEEEAPEALEADDLDLTKAPPEEVAVNASAPEAKEAVAEPAPTDEEFLDLTDTVELDDISPEKIVQNRFASPEIAAKVAAQVAEGAKTDDEEDTGEFSGSLDKELETALDTSSDAVVAEPGTAPGKETVSVRVHNRADVEMPTDFNYHAIDEWHEGVRKKMADSVGAVMVSPEQLENALVRAIKEVYAEKIETLIEDAVEKTVQREIDKLQKLVSGEDG